MSSPNNSRGFTLVEVLVAVAVLAGGLVLIVQGLARTQQALKISKNMVQASQLADQRFSLIEFELYDKKKLSTSLDSGTERIPPMEIKWKSEVSVYDSSGMTKMNQADVTVFWKDGGGRENKARVSGLLLDCPKKEIP